MTNTKIPIYDVIIDEHDESGVDFISLVDEPAMQLDWLKFSKEELVEQEFKADRDKKMVYGVFIVCDKLIERNSKERGDYYTRFRAPEIEKIVKKFSKNNFNRNINFQHGDNTVKAFVVESFITSPLVRTEFGYDVPDGSWVGSVHIEDEKFWEDYIKSGSLNGFSVELRSKLVPADFKELSFKSYTDYPQGVKETAQRVLKWVEENGWGSCGTDVGKQRANQLAKGEPISEETIKRMYSFLARHKGQDADKGSYGDGCGRLMYDAWGGDAALSWSERKLSQIEKERMNEELFNTINDIVNSDKDPEVMFNNISMLFDLTTVRVPSSSNVRLLRYDDETKVLRIQFHDTAIYEYDNVDEATFIKIKEGKAKPRTTGSNEFGSWQRGISPSNGAAVHQFLIEAGKDFRRV